MAKNGRKNHRRSHEKQIERNDKVENHSSGSKGLSQSSSEDPCTEETDTQIAQNSVPIFGPERPPAEDQGGNGTDRPALDSKDLQLPSKGAARPSQHQHDYTVQERLQNELQYYKVELETEYNKRWETEQLELRRLRKVERDFEKLQAKELQAVEQFQGKPDESFTGTLRMIDRKMMRSLVNFLGKCPNQLEGTELSAKLKPYIWLGPYDDQVDIDDKDTRKKLLKSMIWKFLRYNLFARPFMCFGGRNGELADELYSTLYHERYEYPESIKWRTFTVERLQASLSEEDDADTCERLIGEFQTVLNDLGYMINDKILQEKSKPLFTAAILLAKDFAGQRAIYQFFNPDNTEKNWYQRARSEYCTNVEDDNEEVSDEGKIAFIVVPALLRYGTERGEALTDRPVVLSKAFVHLE